MPTCSTLVDSNKMLVVREYHHIIFLCGEGQSVAVGGKPRRYLAIEAKSIIFTHFWGDFT